MAEWLLVDGSSLIFRAYYGIPNTVKSPAGMPVNGIRGLLDMLARLITDRKPARLLVATDEDWRPRFRVDLLPSYKSHRVAEPIPDELSPQVPIAWTVLGAVGLEVVGADGFEAEDVIASAASRIDGTIEIVSGDRDLFALVRDPVVSVLYPEGMGQLKVVDEAELARRYGIGGRQYADFAILRGDPSDGLPGLPGVGPKKAADLLKRYGSVDGLLRDGNLRSADREYLERARGVVPPVTDIPLQLPDCRLPVAPRDPVRLEELRREYNLSGPVERLSRSLGFNQHDQP